MRYKHIWTQAAVVNIRDIANNVRLFELAPEIGTQPYNAGAHIDVTVWIDDQPHIRSYSLIGQYTHDGHYRIAVKRLPTSRGGSDYMWRLTVGARLTIAQPQNFFQLTFGQPAYVLIAGGIGITPIYGMALELLDKGANFRLLYAGSSRREMPFIDDLQTRLGNRLSIYASDEGQRMDIAREISAIAAGTQVYVCAPMRMLDAVRHIWQAHNRPTGDLRYETFAASGQFATQPFEVSIPRFGATITVPENQTLLDALNNAGIDVMSDCLRGECGLCVVDVLDCSGKIDHRDFFFSDEQKAENHKLCACVSRVVEGRVVIDTAYRGRLSQI